MITFEPFWKTLKERKISQYDLINSYNMSRGMLDNLKHNRSITLNTLNQLCKTFDCDISDIIIYKKD
ncbi:MAG: helix-turn-helix transcriptional regulator [Lachnospiraceae bacterium]|jgi:DNA-binding Xre family transcriptional regulator|nr:helix-turn-helix transcriptional regulator [Lachnospiraceae bacterium]MCI9283315.1 helix-turn-helix transcriptional regulator [Lachnospiraceae bacterium]